MLTGVADANQNLVPVGATKDQICAIVGKYLESHPEEWTQEGAVIVKKALIKAFQKK